jgi:hypothetical protein
MTPEQQSAHGKELEQKIAELVKRFETASG